MAKAVAQSGVTQLSDVLTSNYWNRGSSVFCEVCDNQIVRVFYYAPMVGTGTTYKLACRACHRRRGRPLELAGGGKFERQKDNRFLLVARRDDEDGTSW